MMVLVVVSGDKTFYCGKIGVHHGEIILNPLVKGIKKY